MNKTTLALALLGTFVSASAMAEKLDNHSWSNWVKVAGTGPVTNHVDAPRATVSFVPAGTANYAGATVATVSDSSSGTLVKSVSTGTVNLAVTFNGTGATTETGTITGLTGAGGAAIGDLAFTASGAKSNFSGTVTSATYPAIAAVPGVAATATTAAVPAVPATGTGSINGDLSSPVVVTPAVAATSTSAAVPAVVEAPLSVAGSWKFVATSALKVSGTFASVKK